MNEILSFYLLTSGTGFDKSARKFVGKGNFFRWKKGWNDN